MLDKRCLTYDQRKQFCKRQGDEKQFKTAFPHHHLRLPNELENRWWVNKRKEHFGCMSIYFSCFESGHFTYFIPIIVVDIRQVAFREK